MFGIPYDASVYYPSDLLDEYRNIAVSADDVGATVKVTRYRNARHSADQGGTKDSETVKDGFLDVSKFKIVHEAGGALHLVEVFTGKGSPEDIGRVLGLVWKYRDDFVKKYKGHHGPQGDCARLLEESDDPQVVLQAFCDAHVGLDCNGFVGNFARKIRAPGLGPQISPAQFYQRRRATRHTLEDVLNLDVIVWADASHIAVVDSFDASLQHVSIVQSTGGGPQMSMHGLVPQGNGLFRIAPPTKVAGSVHVVSLGWS